MLIHVTGEDGTPEQKQRWENTIAFFAELDAGSQGREFDYTSRAKSYIHAALSGNLEPETREVRIRLACIWYAHDAAKLWDKMADRNADRVQWRDWAHCLRSKSEESFEDEGTRILIVRAFNQICHVSQE